MKRQKEISGDISPDLPELAEALRQAVSDFVRTVRAQVDGPTSAQSETLVQLDRAGPQSVAALAEIRNVKHQSMRQVVGNLEADGLVVREPDPKDKRGSLVVLTAAGNTFLKSAKDARSQWLAEVIGKKLSEADLLAIKASIPVLRKIAEIKGPLDE
ncbi:MarR family winged helix-turn-helix transcriptional regulator [Undibacterium sp. TJN19]|uniref:MarR family winged helix-turn-helix transcriptional regulator n=1 Tax=Undibacterium sp. TJN19 TaxID=3413055 RepID=UPI003BF2B4A4